VRLVERATEELRSRLTARPIDGWVVVYRTIGGPPTFYQITDNGGWVAAGIEECTVFDTYEAACAASRRSRYLDKLLPPEKRVVKLRVEAIVTIEVEQDLPIDPLDALAEI